MIGGPNVVLQLRRRPCRCLLGIVVREGDRLLLAGHKREQVWRQADRWEPLASDFGLELNVEQCPITLGCRHGRVVVGAGADVIGETPLEDLLAAVRASTRRGQVHLLE